MKLLMLSKSKDTHAANQLDTCVKVLSFLWWPPPRTIVLVIACNIGISHKGERRKKKKKSYPAVAFKLVILWCFGLYIDCCKTDS